MRPASQPPIAWMLFVLQLTYLLVLLSLAYFTFKWPGYGLWAGLVTLHTKTAWFGALGGIAVGLYGLYTHIQARDFEAQPIDFAAYISKPISRRHLRMVRRPCFSGSILSIQAGGADQPLYCFISSPF